MEPAQLRPFGLLDTERQPDPANQTPETAIARPEPDTRSLRRPLRVGPRPRYALPTDRIAWQRQPVLLRTFAVAYASGGESVSVSEVASIMGLAANTASLNTQFLIEAGLLMRSDGGRVIPTEATREYARAYEWNPDTAGQALAPALRGTWFGKTLEKRLLIQGTLSVSDAVEALAAEAGASASYQQQIKLLIDYLELAKVVGRDGDSLRLIRASGNQDVRQPVEPPPQNETPEPSGTPPFVKTTPPGSHTPKPAGGVQFNISIDVDMAELSTWSPDRLTAFFSGLAAVIAAKEGKVP